MVKLINVISSGTGGELLNIPNILTIIRFALIPVFAYYLYTGEYITAVLVFLLAGATDILDGFIARKLCMSSNWGKIADPMADKLMQITALVVLSAFKGIVPLWLLIFVVVKELFMALGGLFLYRQKKHVVSADWYGKMASVVFFIVIIFIMLKDTVSFIPDVQVLVGVAFIAILFAFFMYIKTFIRIKRG
jgi:cardiolipin synthase